MSFRKQNSYILYRNTFQNRKGIDAYFYNTAETVARMMFDDYRNKTPFIASFDSLTRMEQSLAEMRKRVQTMKDAELYDQLLKYIVRNTVVIRRMQTKSSIKMLLKASIGCTSVQVFVRQL
jgi:hypothetical protein